MLERLSSTPGLGDVALENVQARLRTLILMTVANREDGVVVGTGDLSEKALGWSTYAGDHIAMYDVNAGVPKTLIQSVIRWVANERVHTWSQGDPTHLREVLFDILDTPISPELLPADADGRIAQLTEEAIGPYELHDFYLYHLVRHGARPRRILDLARIAFAGDYDVPTLQRWLTVFVKRCRRAGTGACRPTRAPTRGSTKSRPTRTLILRHETVGHRRDRARSLPPRPS
jgi:NAD+ synthase (glutamine-hydrolysing)